MLRLDDVFGMLPRMMGARRHVNDQGWRRAPRQGRCTPDPGCQLTGIEGKAPQAGGVTGRNGFAAWDIPRPTFRRSIKQQVAALDDDLFYCESFRQRDTTTCVSIRKQGLFSSSVAAQGQPEAGCR